MEFTPIKNKKLYLQVIHQIQQMICDGKLHKGDKLPPERELASILGVSRTAIREAFSALELLGIIESRQGEGTFISPCPLDQKIIEPLSLIFMLEGSAQKDLLQLRTLLEVECAKLAAEHASKEELKKMQDYLAVLHAQQDDHLLGVQTDRELHFTIAKAGKNVFLYYIFMAISDVLDKHIANMRQRIMQKPENTERLITQHQQIIDAIVHHQPSMAGKAMLIHKNFIRDEVYAQL